MSAPTGDLTSTPTILSILPGNWSNKRAKIAHPSIEASGVRLMIHCVLHDPQDSVAVVVVEGIKAGQTLTGLILDQDRTITLPCTQDIPLGHKVALKDMKVGDTVIKYGVDIGKVVAPIKTGQHAHVHNIKTKRW
jgi:(2R)-sulfolactate sulfo-lyase subunit alpha